MASTTIDGINQLTAERSKLYSLAGSGRLRAAEQRQRLQQISSELESLWERRRQERAGRPDDIDLLVDRAYRQVYGNDYESALAPAPAAEEDEAARAAA